MEYSYDFLPKNVQKLLKRMANLQRKELALLKSCNESDSMPEDFDQKLSDLFIKGTKAVEDLLNTRFADEEFGFTPNGEATDAEMLQNIGDYFLGVYARGRFVAEAKNEEPDEDMYYAACLILHRYALVDQHEDDYEIEEYDSNDDDDDYEPLIDRLVEEFGDLTAETADSKKKAKIVPLFGDGKDKLQ